MEKMMYYPHLYNALKEYGAAAEKRYKELLLAEGKNASKTLYDSVHFVVKKDDKTYEVGLNLAYYWKFVEGGTKGAKYPNALCRQHFPPVLPIERWIIAKRIVPRADKNGRIPKLKQLGFLIARGIAKNGIKPAPILAQTSEEVKARFYKKVMEAFALDAHARVKELLDEFLAPPK